MCKLIDHVDCIVTNVGCGVPGSCSASTSPARTPSPSQRYNHQSRPTRRYGTTRLEQRSRSPSPLGTGRGPGSQHQSDLDHYSHNHQQLSHPIQQQSYPVLVSRRGHGRRLPDTPSKPSTLQLRPASINFPKLNASPTHCPAGPIGPMPLGPPSQQQCPLSFEQAVAIGRGGRMLPSPVPNGYKPGQQRRSRHSDSDDDDWC